MQSLQRNLCYAIFAEPTLSQPLSTSKALESIALSNRGYAAFAMQSLLRNLCQACLEPTFANGKISKSIALSNFGYAVVAMQSLLRNLCRAYLEPTFANEKIIGIHCSEHSWLGSLCKFLLSIH